ncbi:arf-GAP domain and FG repeat-containing protein 2 [Leptonychotes weddellii]|uniref:Arf-GAP domain and FG repeat-containing protein 2 n=1 Tax=Leptonychotes weddellii TaxID=9713 RepID=A0A7F8QVP7_LEPWE|nr:arf-GAP domain and FG repeat-containing protein 2 [Leptonychotes weddellii]
MVMAAKKGPGPGGGVSGGKAEAEAASEVWCRRVRELGGCSQAGNRHCFECAQRGVTYVDITVGSFVCTTCSGLLTPCSVSCDCPGSSQVTPFAASPLAPASQPNSLTDMSSLLAPGASPGGIPSSIFGVAGQVPTLQSATAGGGGSTGLAFGAFTNPFTVPAAHPQLPSTNPFQPNGLATGPSFGMSSAGPGFPQTVPPTRAFVSTFPPPLFPPQTSMTQQQNGSSFSDLGSAKLGQRQLSQPAGTSTNPFMTGSSSSPFASKPPTTNPFL